MMSQPTAQTSVMEYTVRVPKNSKKKYHMMRFHTASGVEFKNWSSVKMERENNYKEFKSLDDDQPRFGAGSEFGREQRDEARRKRYGINIRKYKPDDQPWLLSVKDKPNSNIKGTSTAIDKKFKGVREGGVSDNVAWYVFLQAKDGAFEAYPVEEWYNFQPINRYKALNAEEAEKEFERRDKIMNYFSVMVSKKLRNDEEEGDPEDGGNNKSSAPSKSLQLSEMDDWMSDKESDDDGEGEDEDSKEPKPKKKPAGKPSKGRKRKQGGKTKKKEDGGSGTDCEEESDEYDEGAEHEYESEDSSDPEQENDEKVNKDLTGVEEGKALKTLLDSEDEDDEDDENKKLEEEKKAKEEQPEGSGDEDKKKKAKKDSSPDLSDSSEDEKPKVKDLNKKLAANGSMKDNSNADILKRKLADNPDGLQPASKRSRTDGAAAPAPVLPSDSGMFEDQIRRYLVRKPMTTTEILQKLKSKKTGHGSKQLVDIIAVMLKKINPHKQHVKGKMYLSLKTLNG